MEAKSSPEPMVTCEICDQKILHTKLKQHLVECRLQNGGEIFKCSDCNKAFKTKQTLSRHVRAVHSEPVKCPFQNCDAVIKKKSLSNHTKMVHERLREECKNCGKKITYTNLNAHIKLCTSNGSRPFECPEKGCKATFRTSADRSSHIYHVHREPVKCSFQNCDAVLKKNSLSNHIKMVHERLRAECKNCGKKISCINLAKHLKLCTSNGSRPFECRENDCDATFRTSAVRSSHISQVHSEPIECSFANCGAVINKYHLPTHAKLVHERLEEECEHCGEKISCINLAKHLKSCTSNGTRPFECSEGVCDSTLSTSAESSNHISNMQSELSKQIECPFPQGGASITKQYFPEHVRTFVQQHMKLFADYYTAKWKQNWDQNQ